MRHPVYPTLEALLAPETLGALEGWRVSTVHMTPFATVDSASGSAFLAVETGGDSGAEPSEMQRHYLVKRSGPTRDWIMRATADPGREALLWVEGILDRLPPEVGHTILAAARDEDLRDVGDTGVADTAARSGERGWALLLRDVSPSLLPDRFAPLPPEDNAALLEAIAALHAAFFDAAATLDAASYLCAPERYYTALAPATGRREQGATPQAPRILRGWELLPTLVSPEVAQTVAALHADPTPLCAALARYPRTLLHGDLRRANLALIRHPTASTFARKAPGGYSQGAEAQVVLLDWQLASYGPPPTDLAWCLADPRQQPISKEDTIAIYRGSLARRLGARFATAWWEPALALGLLGGLLRFGWLLALFAVEHADLSLRVHYQGELAWWAERAREAVRWL